MCESTDLDVVKKVLVDAEQSMGKFVSQVLTIIISLFLHQNQQQICHSLSIVYVIIQKRRKDQLPSYIP